MDKKMSHDLTNTFRKLDQIRRKKRLTYNNGEVAWLMKDKEGGSFTLKDGSFKIRHDEIDIILKNRSAEIKIPYLLSYSVQTTIKDSVIRENTYKVSSFKSTDFNEEQKAFYRLLVPVKKRLDFFNTLQYDTISRTSFDVFKRKFDFYEITDNKLKYLVIESRNEREFARFSDECFSVLLCYAFLTGDFFQGENYYFSYDDAEMKTPNSYSFNAFRGSVFSILRPICINPHAYDIEGVEMEELEPVSKKQFSVLVEKSISNVDFRMLLLQVIEASNATLVTSTFMLAVCLEEMVELFLQEDEKHKRLGDEEQRIYTDLISYLGQINYQSEEAKSLLSAFKSQIHNIGKNASNMQKIYSLFKGFNLTRREKEALKNRNKLLHGTLPEIKGVSMDSENNVDKAYWYLQQRLYTLVSMVILKNIGFKNKILNHYSLNERAIGFFELEESSYRDLSD